MIRITLNLLACIALASCTKKAGIGYSYGLFRSESASDFANVSEELHDWLVESGRKPVPSPGGVAEASGLHGNGDKVTWYQTMIGRHKLLFRISLDPRGKVIQADTDYGGEFTLSELSNMRQANLKLWNDVFSWIESQPQRNEILVKNPKYFDSARTDVKRVFED